MQCLNCQIHTENPRFCSRSCSASYNNRLSPKRQRVIRQPDTTCKSCGNTFIKRRKEHKFCSKQCSVDYYKLLLYTKFERDGRFYPCDDTPRNSTTVRNYLIHKYGNICMICGQSGENWNKKPMTLIIDHINGDSRDWSMGNIQMVCSNCDSQLPTYKGRNKGKSTRKYTITQK